MNRRGFTLVELMVVVGMILVLVGALTTSTTAARKRARVQKATADVKLITQAILSYEQWAAKNGKPMRTFDQPVDCDSGNLDFLLGKETDGNGGNIPVLLMAQLQSGGKLTDPWGHPYKMTIKEGNAQVKWSSGSMSSGSIRTGYSLPNYYRVTPGERPIEER